MKEGYEEIVMETFRFDSEDILTSSLCPEEGESDPVPFGPPTEG